MVHGQVPALPTDSNFVGEGNVHMWNPDHPDVWPHAPSHRSGSRVQAWPREAGFDPGLITKDASVDVNANPGQRERYGSVMSGGLRRMDIEMRF